MVLWKCACEKGDFEGKDTNKVCYSILTLLQRPFEN